MRETSYEWIRDVRATKPSAIAEAAQRRRRRRTLMDDSGRLMIVAADHTARGTMGIRKDPSRMADRHDLLERLVIALGRPGVDGVVGTADILDDLLLLGALEDKVVLGAMNRGGLHGASWAIDDRFNGYDADWIERTGFDGGKMLLRVSLEHPATASTLESCGLAITALAERGLLALVEPFMAASTDGDVRTDLDPDAVIRSVAIASGLGSTSAHTWLKLPVVEDMERVMAATTLPTLLLGGDPDEDPDVVYEAWGRALRLPGVRGLVVGRALLFPPDDDVAGAVDRAAALVRPTPSAVG